MKREPGLDNFGNFFSNPVAKDIKGNRFAVMKI